MKLVVFKDCGVQCYEANGVSRSIATFWNPQLVQVLAIVTSPNNIATRYFNLIDGSSWILSNIYALNGNNSRKSLWSYMMNASYNFPYEKWILMGDFNTPISNLEKLGGALIFEDSKQDLLDMINSLGLLDLDLGGAKFTWSTMRSGLYNIQVRLDRGLIFVDWLLDSSYCFSSLSKIGCDHFPISLSISSLTRRQAFPFTFEKMWTLNTDLYEYIEEWWDSNIQGTTMFRVAKKTANIMLLFTKVVISCMTKVIIYTLVG